MTGAFICVAAAVLYIAELIFFLVKISASKKEFSAGGRPVPPAGKSYKAGFVFSALLVLLPLAVPLKLYVIAVVCATGVLGEFIMLKERLENLRQVKTELKAG
ncbi:MAG: hypothetical protein J6Z17_04100 [Treponema sp.]|nr:hypothetical protein [Treponema sp.]